jgi:SAM-dependent methyltransferase
MGAHAHGQMISEKANSLLKGRENKTLLEAGCGSASYFSFDDIVKSVGIDIDEDQLRKNTLLDEKILGDLETYRLPSAKFDVVVCWDVIEHLSRPQKALANLFNSLKPGGLIILGFPNLMSFKGIVTKATPFWFHEAFYRFMKYSARHFPTYLRMDIIPGRVVSFAERSGLSIEYYEMVEGGLTARVRKQFWLLNKSFQLTNLVWRVLSLSRSRSLFLDSCMLIMRKREVLVVENSAAQLRAN